MADIDKWSFSPSLPSGIHASVDSSGKLTLRVDKNAVTKDTTYTVTYNDGNGCKATTQFSVKQNCSGGGGGGDTSGKCTVYVENDSNTSLANLRNRALITLKNGVQVNLWLDGTKDSQNTFSVEAQDHSRFTNAGFMPYDSSLTLDQIIGKTISTDCINRGDAEDPKTRLYQMKDGAWTNLQDISTLSVVTYLDDGGDYSQTTLNKGGSYTIKIADRCPGSCKITGATLEAADYGAKTIGTLPNSGTWTFDPNFVAWLGNITANGTNVIADNVSENTNVQEPTNTRTSVITATCTGSNCGDCTGTHTFKVTQKGTRVECSATGYDTSIGSAGGNHELVGTYTTDCTITATTYVEGQGENFASNFSYENGNIYADILENTGIYRESTYIAHFSDGQEDGFTVKQDGNGGGGDNIIYLRFHNNTTDTIEIGGYYIYVTPYPNVEDCINPTPQPGNPCDFGVYHSDFDADGIHIIIPAGETSDPITIDTTAAKDWLHVDTIYWQNDTPRYECEGNVYEGDKAVKIYKYPSPPHDSDTILADFKSGEVIMGQEYTFELHY